MKHFASEPPGMGIYQVILLVFLFSCTYSQKVYDSRPMNFGTQAAALGDAYAAQIQDISSMYWNPAAIAFLDKSTVLANAIMDSQSEVFHHMLAAPLWNFNDHFLAVGIAGSHFGNRWYQPYFSTYGADICYALKLTPFVSVGALLNLRYGQTNVSSLWAGSGSFGVLYYPSRSITYGVRLGGIGSGIVYAQEGIRETMSHEWQLPQSLTVGSTFRFPTTTSYSNLTLSFDSGLSFRTKNLTNGFGIEVSPWKFFTVRLGFSSEDSVTMFRYGVGIQTGFIQAGYAFVPLPSGNHYHHSSLSVSLVNW